MSLESNVIATVLAAELIICIIALWYCDVSIVKHKRELAAKDDEIARMRAALKPVMECDAERMCEHD